MLQYIVVIVTVYELSCVKGSPLETIPRWLQHVLLWLLCFAEAQHLPRLCLQGLCYLRPCPHPKKSGPKKRVTRPEAPVGWSGTTDVEITNESRNTKPQEMFALSDPCWMDKININKPTCLEALLRH